MLKDDCLLERLVEIRGNNNGRPVMSREDFEAFKVAAKRAEMGVVDFLLHSNLLSSDRVARARAEQFGVEFVNLEILGIPSGLVELIPQKIARQYDVIPIGKGDHTIRVAIADPSDLDKIDCLMHALNTEIEIVVASEEAIEAALQKYYPPIIETIETGGVEAVQQP